MKLLSLSELYDELVRFDWWYDYSDDHRVWTNGVSAEKELGVHSTMLRRSAKGNQKIVVIILNNHDLQLSS